MTLSQAQIEAYAAMDAAIDQLRAAFDADDAIDPHQTGEVITGWILVTHGVKLWDESDLNKPQDDDATQTVVGYYRKRGQSPVVSSGLALAFLQYNSGL